MVLSIWEKRQKEEKGREIGFVRRRVWLGVSLYKQLWKETMRLRKRWEGSLKCWALKFGGGFVLYFCVVGKSQFHIGLESSRFGTFSPYNLTPK